jgi:ribosomal protein S27AE
MLRRNKDYSMEQKVCQVGNLCSKCGSLMSRDKDSLHCFACGNIEFRAWVPECKYCGQTSVVRFGHLEDIQLFWCNDCKRKFRDDKRPFRKRFGAEVMKYALSRRKEGFFFSTISGEIRQIFGVVVANPTIRHWCYNAKRDSQNSQRQMQQNKP